MEPEQVEELRNRWSGLTVTVDPRRPELARMQGRLGRVVTISYNGAALVEFEGPDRGWYDIAPEFLRVVDAAEDEAKEPSPSDETPSDRAAGR